ncbi:MAG: response regulator [Hyphomonadaceae bacterium]
MRAGGVYHVTECETAADAFEVMRTTLVDLIILDWNMQPIDGLSFTRMLRLEPNSPNPMAPILMLTAHTEASRVAAARDAGVTGFVKKPVSARLLFERVSSALTDTRMFIRTPGFFGPDRRHDQLPGYDGPWRRETDPQNGGQAVVDLDDDARWRA